MAGTALAKACRCIRQTALFGAFLLGPSPAGALLASEAQPRTVIEAGSTIAYSRVAGRGTPFILLHGWASDSTIWDLLTPRLRQIGPSYAVDAPGSGFSPRGRSPFTYRRYAGAAAAVIARERLQSVIVVAHSFGAYAARELVRAHPRTACAIVLVDASFIRPFANQEALQTFMTRVTEQPWPGFFEARDRPDGASAETLRRLPAMHRSASRESAVAWLESLGDDRLYGEDHVTIPVLMILRAGSTWATEEHLAELRAIAPLLQVRRLGQVSHFVAWDAPDQVTDLIRDFGRDLSCG